MRLKSATLGGTRFEFGGKEHFIGLLGLYQPRNAAVVLTATDILRNNGIKISDSAVESGLAEAIWQARFERLASDPIVIYDGGHNPQGVRAAVESVKAYFGDRRIDLLVGILADKNYSEMVKTLSVIAENVTCITPPSPRALPAETLAEEFRKEGLNAVAAQSIEEGVRTALSRKRDLLAIGSLYSYGAIADNVRKAQKGTAE